MPDSDTFARWSFLPGSPVKVALLGLPSTATRIKTLLPDHWHADGLWKWEALVGKLHQFQVLLAALPTGDVSELEERLAALAILPDPLPLVLYGRVTPESLEFVQAVMKALPVVELATADSDRQRLPRIVNEVRGRAMLYHLAGELSPALESSPMIMTGLRKCLLQRPLPEGKAIAILDRGDRPFMRKAGHLADEMSCSLSFLDEQARRVDVRLDYAVRFITLLHVMTLYGRRITPFVSIAPRIGLKSGPAVTRFVRRVAHLPPKHAVRTRLGEWGHEFAKSIIGA